MALTVNFNRDSPAKLKTVGVHLDVITPQTFNSVFEIEPPVVIQGTLWLDNPIRIGAFSANYGGRLRNLRIGRYCSIAPDLQTGWDNHPTDWVSTSMLAYVRDIHNWASFTDHADHSPVHRFRSMAGVTHIGNDVWIGYGAFITAGVTIGDGAVIGARSVVTRDVPPYAIVAGVPAKIIRYRYPEKVIAELLRLQWWRYNLMDFPPALVNDVRRFLGHLEAAIEQREIQPYQPKILRAEDIQQIVEG